MVEFIHALEKAELHLHLEGSVEPETLLELDPTLSMETIRDAYQFPDFAGFLRSYVWVTKRLARPDDYAIAARHLLQRLIEQNVRYVELNVSAGVILWKEQDFESIFRAVRQETWQSPVEVHWIFDAVRQFGRDHVRTVAEMAVEHRADGVVGFGIGGDEKRGPAEDFIDIFEWTKANGLASLPHGGETMDASAVWSTLKLNPDRIGHGIAAAQDPTLMRHLRDNNIPLEICISSNVFTGSVASVDAHPVRRLFDAGVPITLNTDDPAMFKTSLEHEYRIAAERFGFSQAELQQIADNSFRYAVKSPRLPEDTSPPIVR
jgi:adenosine deaminase/aminodeoxyfutalosine deaminase